MGTANITNQHYTAMKTIHEPTLDKIYEIATDNSRGFPFRKLTATDLAEHPELRHIFFSHSYYMSRMFDIMFDIKRSRTYTPNESVVETIEWFYKDIVGFVDHYCSTRKYAHGFDEKYFRSHWDDVVKQVLFLLPVDHELYPVYKGVGESKVETSHTRRSNINISGHIPPLPRASGLDSDVWACVALISWLILLIWFLDTIIKNP